MFLYNLSIGEFLLLFTAAAGVVTALYLLDRSRRKVAVATLRFWAEARRPVESTSRRRIRQWPSLLMQLASIAALLLALSQLRLGSRDDAWRDHVVLLDTSAWMSARGSANGPPLIDEAKELVSRYLRAIPGSDRVMIVYADAISTPATSFESNRRNAEAAVRRARPGSAALDLNQAFAYAQRLLARSAHPGEIVFAGASRLAGAENLNPPRNLRVLAVKASPENVGLKKVGVRHSAAERDLWHVYVSVRNYGTRPRAVDLGVHFGGAPVGTRRLTLKPSEEVESAFEFRTRSKGPLEARIRSGGDLFPADDRASLELPSLAAIPITVCTDEPQLFRPLVEAHSGVEPVFKPSGQCAEAPAEGIAIYDRVAPAAGGRLPSLYIEPPASGSPVRLASSAAGVSIEKWNGSHPVAAGLRARDLRLVSAQVFAPAAGDVAIAESASGPVAIAREGSGRRMVVLGFHPARALKFELTTPLLFANILRWLSPGSFRQWELFASSVGTVSVPIDAEAKDAPLRVIAEDGTEIPFTRAETVLRFFSGKPGAVRVLAGDREQIHSLTLPAVPETLWTAPQSVRRGIPRPRETGATSRDIWYWLALAGGLGLLIEWLLFSPSGMPAPGAGKKSVRQAA